MATPVTALLRLLWRTQSFSVSFNDSRPFSRPKVCAVQRLFMKSLRASAEPNSVLKREKGKKRGQLAIAILIICELT
jgi:hypothetical protein